MKLHTPEGRELMEVQSVEHDGHTLVVRGVIMGTMPARAVIHPEELRAAFRLLSLSLVLGIVALLFRRSAPKAR
jgi:hypothetical protein